MIELELPCCGDIALTVELRDEIRCERCGIVAELGPDPEPATTVAPLAVIASALAA